MDSNQTRYHHVLRETEWIGTAEAPRPGAQHFAYSGEMLQLKQRIRLHRASALDMGLSLAARRGGHRDERGGWLRIDASERALVLQRSGLADQRFWPPLPDDTVGAFTASDAPAAEASLLRGLCVTTRGYLVVGMPEEESLLLLDLRGSINAEVITLGRGFRPWDLAALADGGFVALDRGADPLSATETRLWRFDANLNLMAASVTPADRDAFAPVAARGVGPAPQPGSPAPLSLGGDFVAVEAFLEGELLLFERGGSGGGPRLHRRKLEGPEEPDRAPVEVLPAVAAARDTEDTDDMALGDALDLCWQPTPTIAHEHGSILVALSGGNQAFRFRVPKDASANAVAGDWAVLVPDHLPTPRFGGRGLLLGGGRVHFDTGRGDRWGLAPLTPSRRRRYDSRINGKAPHLVLAVMDSALHDCVWHRVILEGVLPPGCSVQVESRAADSVEALETEGATWWPQPAFVVRTRSDLPGRDLRPDERVWDLLLQEGSAFEPNRATGNRGRFLQLRLTIIGTSAATPMLRALRVYFPRFSYLEQYLPAVWRDDPVAARFTDRFLANVEGMFTDLEDWIAAAHLLLDPLTAPAEALPWLASWFQISLHPAWSTEKSRFFLQNISHYLRWRGTLRGVRAVVRLALAERVTGALLDDEAIGEVRVIELFRLRRTPADTPLPTERWVPAEGRGALQERWRAAGGSSDFPLSPSAEQTQHWVRFAQEVIGGVPDPGAQDLPAWRGFLRRRYRRPGALTAAWGRPVERFSQVELPSRVPADGPALTDWYDFVTQVLPRRRAAHRFIVAVPDPGPSTEARARLRGLVTAVVNAEKPADTSFVVRFNADDFVVGRDGPGTGSLGATARTAMTAPGLVLGTDELGASSLGAPPTGDVRDRIVLGRDRLGGSSEEGT